MRTTYAVVVDHEKGEEPILFVSEGAHIVSVSFIETRPTRVTPPEATQP